MNALCIITARGGSKRIPRKNLRPFLDKPIICYPIEAALASNLFDVVMVSTDDAEIADLALKAGAQVPFLRSSGASDDHATTAEVLLEVLARYEEEGRTFDLACCCYPTAPFITPMKLEAAYRRLLESDADSVIPITEYTTPIFRALSLESGSLNFIWPENANRRSQDLPTAYHDTGQFYFFRVARFLANGSLLSPNTQGLRIPNSETQDIDNEEDWALAEIKYKLWRERQQALPEGDKR